MNYHLWLQFVQLRGRLTKMYATKQQQQQQQLKPTNLNKNAAFIISKSNIVWTF